MSQENNMTDVKKKNSGRRMLLGLAVIFILPFTIAATLHILDIRPSGKSFGHLITPPIKLSFPALKEVGGEEFTAEHWNKIWSIVMVDDKSCDESCTKNVDKLNRVHLSLPKDFDRVQRILILKGEVDSVKVGQLQAGFPDLVILVSHSVEQNNFVNVFTDAASMGSVYLVDPLNNLMMHYPYEVTPKELRSDVQRLLKNSWGG